MNKEHFTILLEDLYQRYNHTKITEVPVIVEKYNGQEFDAIKTFYFKYNFKSHPNYDPKAGSDAFIRNLITEYSEGKRPIIEIKKEESETEREINLLTQQLKESKTEWEKSVDSIKKELEDFVNSKQNVFKEYEDDIKKSWVQTTKNIETMIKKKEAEIEDFIKKFDEQVEARLTQLEPARKQEPFEVSITITNAELDVVFPNGIETLAVGSRFLLNDSSSNRIAFEIKDIFLDYISNPEKPIKEISVERI
jgi:hypothetical protein